MTCTPARYPLPIYQGATFREHFIRALYPYPTRLECDQLVKLNGDPAPASDATPEDYTGCSARMQLRVAVGSTEVILELTTANGGITLSGNTLILHLSPAQTSALVYGRVQPGWLCAVGHVEVTRPNGDVERQYEFEFVLDPEGTV